MAKQDKLITFAYLRGEVDIPQNIEEQELDHAIYRAQEMLRMVMCDEFYQDYVTQYKANIFPESYTSLYRYIKQFVAWQAYQFWTVKANFKPTRSGFRVHTEDNSVVASDQQMAMLIKDAKFQAEYYKKLLIDHLNANKDVYTLYTCNNCGSVPGNSFHISAVKNKTKQPEPFGTRRGCTEC